MVDEYGHESDEEEAKSDNRKRSRRLKLNHKFLIINNYHKSSKIKQLYKVSMRKNIISLVGPPSKHQEEEEY